MSAYIVLNYTVTDPEMYQQYMGKAVPLLMKHQGEALVVSTDSESLEGTNTGSNVILKFANKDAAMGFYNDPEYVEARQLRIGASTDHNIFFTEGFVMPEG